MEDNHTGPDTYFALAKDSKVPKTDCRAFFIQCQVSSSKRTLGVGDSQPACRVGIHFSDPAECRSPR
ncbi:protein of unknown function (plasmid) [Candidatus Methylocalor cossyra]|uniref:Uncharacterized protein n=1 Tax=Candidatus Methylocalor cossyra TaxID=3108543 RepID=A0ABM9NN68_9GAMM